MKTLLHYLERNVSTFGDSPALVLPDRTALTWRELWEAANVRAARMAAENVRKGDLVFVAGLPCRELHVQIWACACLGAVFAPMNLQLTAHEYAEYIGKLLKERSAVLVADPAFRDRFSGLPDSVARFSLADADADESWRAMATPLGNFTFTLPDPEDGCYLLATSGSTGFPKAALQSHRAVCALARNSVERRNLRQCDRFLAMSPMFHLGGLSPVGASAVSGAAIYVMAGFDPNIALRRIEEEQITTLGAFDVLLDRLTSLPEFTPEKIRTLRTVMFAGSPRYYEVLRSWGVADISSGYAMTEAFGITQTPRDCDDEFHRQWAVGTVLPGIDVKIVDPATNTEVAPGVSGEIRVRGETLFLGYLGEEIPDTHDDSGYFRTGDRGRFDGAYLFFEGRYKEVVKTGGENVAEMEVESLLAREFPEIYKVAVVGAPDETWGEVVCAFVEFIPGQELDLESIRLRGRARMAGFKLPRRLITMTAGSWPQLASGKLNKAILRKLAAENSSH